MADSNKDFRLVASSKEGINRAIRILSNWGGVTEQNRIEIIIRPYRRSRTVEQNALMHKWFSVIAAETGDDMLSVKDEFKRRFLPPILKRDDPEYAELAQLLAELSQKGDAEMARKIGSKIIAKLSTSLLNTKQMSEFMDNVERFATDLGITLPQP